MMMMMMVVAMMMVDDSKIGVAESQKPLNTVVC